MLLIKEIISVYLQRFTPLHLLKVEELKIVKYKPVCVVPYFKGLQQVENL